MPRGSARSCDHPTKFEVLNVSVVSGHSFACFSKTFRLVRGPFGGPAASVPIHLVARVLSELHGETLAAEPQHLDTGIDQRLRQLSPLLRRAAAPYVA